MGAGGVARGTACEAGVEGPRRAGAWRAAGPRVEAEELGGALFGEGFVPGREGAVDRVGLALGRGREQAAFGAEEVQVELGERALRQIREGDGELAGLWDRASQCPASLMWVAKPLAVTKMR